MGKCVFDENSSKSHNKGTRRPAFTRLYAWWMCLFVLVLATLSQPAFAQVCAHLSQVSGNFQNGAPGTVAAQALVVHVSDPFDTSGPPYPLTWTVLSGNATFVQSGSGFHIATVTANSDTSINVQFGSVPGDVVVEAAVDNPSATFACGRQTAQFNLTIDAPQTPPPPPPPPPPPAGPPHINFISGEAQSGIIGTAATAPLVIQVLDPSGSPIVGQTMHWAAFVGAPMLSTSSNSTDATGKASITFQYPSTAGPITIRASTTIGGQTINVDFHATALNPVISAFSGDHQTAAAGSPLPSPLVVQIAPPGTTTGSSLDHVAVVWSILDGGGTLGAATTFTDSTGHASNTYTLGSATGLSHIQAAIPGVGNVIFTATATLSIPTSSQFQIVSGNGQNLVPNGPSQPLVVRLSNSAGVGIAGATIQWSASNGTLDATSTITDADGLSHNHFMVNQPGNYSVSASVAHTTLPPVNFTFANGLGNLSLTDRERPIAQAMDRICAALANIPATEITPRQIDLRGRCNELLANASPRPERVAGALNKLINDAVKPQANTAHATQLLQFNNLNTRLDALRNGAGTGGANFGGLALQGSGGAIPLSMLGDVFRKDPTANDSEIGKGFSRWGFFATGTFGQGNFDPTRSRPGFDFDSASLTAGLDYRFNDAFIAGLALGYNRSNSSLSTGTFGSDPSKSDLNGYSVSGYTTWYSKNDFYVDAVATLGWVNYDLSRNIVYQIIGLEGNLLSIDQDATASPNGRQSLLSLSFGKDFSHGAWSFGPFLRGIYSHLNLDEFSESMSNPMGPGSALGMHVDARHVNSATGILGGKLSYVISRDWGVLTPNASLEWNHEFRNDPQTVVARFIYDPTQTPIVMTDPRQDDSYFNLGVGVSAVLPQGRSGYIYLEHIVGFQGIHENRIALGLRVEF